MKSKARRPVDEDEIDAFGMKSQDQCCLAEAAPNSYGCTRAIGHAGDHVAGDGTFVCHRWPQSPPASPVWDGERERLRDAVIKAAGNVPVSCLLSHDCANPDVAEVWRDALRALLGAISALALLDTREASGETDTKREGE